LERLGWEGENPQRVAVPDDDDDDDYMAFMCFVWLPEQRVTFTSHIINR
jgi:hypothetical protein